MKGRTRSVATVPFALSLLVASCGPRPAETGPTPSDRGARGLVPGGEDRPAVDLRSGLVAHYKLDNGRPGREGADDVAVDSAGPGRHGTVTGGATWTAEGSVGGALAFKREGEREGEDDVVTLFGTNELSSPATFAFWMRPRRAETCSVLSGYPDDDDLDRWDVVLCHDNYKVGWAQHEDDRYTYSATTIVEGVWYHVAIVHDLPGGTVKVYVDGEMETAGKVSQDLSSGCTLRMGGGHYGEYAGLIDEVRIYDRALTPNEIDALARTGAGAAAEGKAREARGRHLLLDSRGVEKVENAKLTLGDVKKHPQNPLFREDRPWEPRFDNVYANVIYDEEDGLYKCWYSPFIIDERTTSTPPAERTPESHEYMRVRPRGREMGVCYAFSKDGLSWEKPELGLVDFKGSKRNNILTRGWQMKGVFRGPHGAGIVKDLSETDPARRYKMFFRAQRMAVAFSADGLRWDEPVLCPEIRAPGDTHNNAFWAPELGRYVGITRLKTRKDVRLVGRTESTDYVKWTKARVVLDGLSPRLQTHDMVAFPAGGVYIGLLGMMEFPGESNDRVKQHVELAWSPDTVTWRRIQPGTPFIGHTAAAEDSYGAMPYDWGTVFASAPIFLDDEVRIYYGACDWYFFDWRKGFLALATIRPDGWAGYEQVATDRPAVVTTTPFAPPLASLRITADVGEGGYVKVALLVNGEAVARSKPLRRTVTDAEVEWRDASGIGDLGAGPVRLRFELGNAKLYSYSFGE